MIYLDYSATTPIDERVIDTMADVYRNHIGNAGSRTHLHGDDCRILVEDARRSIAELVGADSSEIVFTSGATESDNIALLGLARYGKAHGLNHVLVSAIEHKAVLGAAEVMAERGFDVEKIPVGNNGSIDVDDALSRIRPNTLLVSVMHVNNETGVIQPVERLGEELSKRHPDVYFHIDAAQSMGKLVDEVRSLKYDLLSGTAHKMYGPQGIGVLIAKRKGYVMPPIEPLMKGGGQERGLRPGTQPVALIAGFGRAAELCSAEWVADLEHNARVKEILINGLESSGLRFDLNGNQGSAIPCCMNVCFDGVSSEALMIAVKKKLSISNGSACNSGSYEPSHVLLAMGFDRSRAESSVRISWGRMLSEEDAIRSFFELFDAVKSLQD